jgi:hypothetical protein
MGLLDVEIVLNGLSRCSPIYKVAACRKLDLSMAGGASVIFSP